MAISSVVGNIIIWMQFIAQASYSVSTMKLALFVRESKLVRDYIKNLCLRVLIGKVV